MKRHHFDNIAVQRHSIAFAVAAAVLCLPAIAAADAMYRWQDDAGRVHYSNRRTASGAELVKLPGLSIARPARRMAEGSSVAEPSAATVRSSAARPQARGCVPDPSRLIAAVGTRLDAIRPEWRTDEDLTLLVAGTPVSYSADAIVEVWPAGPTDAGAALDQAAIAYSHGACPRSPLERYAAAVTAPVDTTHPAGLCPDFRRAAAELDVALSRNRNVARTFEVASAHTASLQVTGSAGRPKPNLPAWVLELASTQSGELAAELDEYTEELTVARDEIDQAARAEGCW
jgi:hypothetical protein